MRHFSQIIEMHSGLAAKDFFIILQWDSQEISRKIQALFFIQVSTDTVYYLWQLTIL
jgi:hypothetical protein